MRLLVTGAGGMLAADVLGAAERAGHEAIPLGRESLDVTRGEAVSEALARLPADALLNCAAFTDVDGAEQAREAAFAVNATGAGHLARAAAGRGIPMLHVSSDYVFDGAGRLDASGRRRPYVESDPTGPRSAYGQSKLAGEGEVLAASALHTVVRSSWLFGLHGRSFVATMLRAGGERESVEVVDDQVGCPTWTAHLAPALIGLLEREVRGLVHLAGGGEVSWNGFAREIFRQAEMACEVRAATTAQLARPAPRPAYSALASERPDVLPMPPWQDGLAGFLAARAGIMRA
ncbi:MAG: dTDP-4-dehydrorhamnose reductase [Acidobacteriota bacterium]|nr:dTDP-4-dehydrorhamnose reductase [Acidobacteriota bacterium]